MGYNYNYYYYHSSIPYHPRVGFAHQEDKLRSTSATRPIPATCRMRHSRGWRPRGSPKRTPSARNTAEQTQGTTTVSFPPGPARRHASSRSVARGPKREDLAQCLCSRYVSVCDTFYGLGIPKPYTQDLACCTFITPLFEAGYQVLGS